jgi:hypothetical protein
LNYKSHDSINIHLKMYSICHQLSLKKKHSKHSALCLSFDILLRTFLVLFLDAMQGHAHQFMGDNLNSYMKLSCRYEE